MHLRKTGFLIAAALAVFAVTPPSGDAQPPAGGPPPQGGFGGGFGQMEARALGEPFKGVTTNGTVTPACTRFARRVSRRSPSCAPRMPSSRR